MPCRLQRYNIFLKSTKEIAENSLYPDVKGQRNHYKDRVICVTHYPNHYRQTFVYFSKKSKKEGVS